MCVKSMTFKMARRAIAVLMTLLLVWTLSGNAFAWNDDEVVGNLGVILKASGKAQATASECTLGAAAADAIRSASGADIAIVCGGDLYSNLLPGEITWAEVQSAFSTEQEIGIASVTAAQLFSLLETSVSHATLVEGTYDLDYEASAFYGFPQISGFTLQYDMSGNPGDRVYLVQLEDGTRLYGDDNETRLTLCASVEMLSGAYGFTGVEYTALGITEAQALAQYIAEGQITSKFDGTGRIDALSTTDNSIIAQYPLVIALVVVILVMLAFAPLNRRRFEKRRQSVIAQVWNDSRQQDGWSDGDQDGM